MSTTFLGDDIAHCVLRAFETLPVKFKPRKLADGRLEWVPLAGIVLSRDHEKPELTCAALATGMKCLPASKIPLAKGNVLHDWHAEVLAIRAFNRWLLNECAELARGGFQGDKGGKSDWIRWREQAGEEQEQPFELKRDVSIHMYCSEAPCGDASMELVMAAQEDDTPWTSHTAIEEGGMLGRGHFDQLGIVRRKPSRPDAPMTLSKSCSDKIAMKQVTGLLGALTTLLVHPQRTYIKTLVLQESQYDPLSVERAFGVKGRMKRLAGWEGRGEYGFRPFAVKTTSREFAYSRRVVGPNPVPSNLSAVYTLGRQEVLVNGVLQGRKQFDMRGASCVSRRLLWKSVLEVAMVAKLSALVSVLKGSTYGSIKGCDVLQDRRVAKQHAKEVALQGWIKNHEDHYWDLVQ